MSDISKQLNDLEIRVSEIERKLLSVYVCTHCGKKALYAYGQDKKGVSLYWCSDKCQKEYFKLFPDEEN